MKCPRCETAVLDERERSGLTIDVCTSCRGVWLDRGELEKLLALAKRELEEERAYYERAPPPPPYAPPPPQYAPPAHAPPAHAPSPARPPDYDREPPSSDRRRDPRSHGYDPRYEGERRPHYKKRSWLANLGEIFD
jgi:Zn-finger nucleic acid-binding protein